VREKEWVNDRDRDGDRGRKRDTARRRRWEETRRRRGARTHKSRGWQRMTLRVVNLWITRAHRHRVTTIYAVYAVVSLCTAMNAGQSNMIITKKLRYARARLYVCVWGEWGRRSSSSSSAVRDRRVGWKTHGGGGVRRDKKSV